MPEIFWFRPSGEELESFKDHIIIHDPLDNGTHLISELYFSSIRINDVGKYICRVEYNVYGLSETVEKSESFVLQVQGKNLYNTNPYV